MKENWLSKNQKKIYITGGILILLLILSPYFLSMPELMFGLLGGVLVGVIFNKIIKNTAERRSMKLNVQKEERSSTGNTGRSGRDTGLRDTSSTESGEAGRRTDTSSTGNRGVRTDTSGRTGTGITIPEVESDEPEGTRIQDRNRKIDEGTPENKIQRGYAEPSRVQDTVDKPDDESKLLNRESDRDIKRESGEDRKTTKPASPSIPRPEPFD